MSVKHVLLWLLLSATYPALAQTKATYYGSLLTRVSRSGTTTDTTRLLFCRNTTGDKLTVYTIGQGVVSSGTAYYLLGSDNDLCLYIRSIDQQYTDSLHIKFNDASYTVTVNKHDRYILFKEAYLSLKTMYSKSIS